VGVGTAMTTNTGHRIEIADSDAHVRVEVDGVTVAETRSARVLRETGLPPRWYLPLADVDPDVLHASEFGSHCPFKGDASYYDVEVGGGVRRSNLIWTYAEPIPGAAAIAGMLSFYPDRAAVFVDGEQI
jgi:uncharacterized protein (DUF427 family)